MQEQDTHPAYLVDLMDRVGITPRSLEGMDRVDIHELAEDLPNVQPDRVVLAAKRWGLW